MMNAACFLSYVLSGFEHLDCWAILRGQEDRKWPLCGAERALREGNGIIEHARYEKNMEK